MDESRKKFQKEIQEMPSRIRKKYEDRKNEFELGRTRYLEKMKGYDDIYEVRKLGDGHRATWKRIDDNKWKALRIGKHDILKNPI